MATGTIKYTIPGYMSIFKRVWYEYTWTNTIAAGSSYSFPADDFGVSTPEGYTPVGFWRLNTGTVYCNILAVVPGATGANTILSIRNMSTTDKSGYTAGIGILYMKSEYAEIITD